MNTKRRGPIVALLAALVLVALAIPGWAAKAIGKTYGITVTPSSAVAAATSVAFTVTLTNTSPGNSNFNSFSLASPTTPGSFTITNAIFGSGNSNPNLSAQIQRTASSVSVTTLDPVKPLQQVVLTVTATTPTITACSTANFSAWVATVWSGSSLAGDQFVANISSGVAGTLTSPCASLDASTYEDSNVDGLPTGESNVGGFTVDLKQGNRVLHTMTTPSTGTGVGTGTFTNLAPGTYDVCERSRTGWSITDPANTAVGSDGCKSVTVPTTGAVAFGNAADAKITVTKYADPNFNGLLDTGEGVLSGWAFQLKDAGGAAIGAVRSTDEAGQIIYTVPAGHAYSVCETDPRSDPSSANYAADPWVNTAPGGNRCTAIAAASLGSGASVGINFRNAQGMLGCGAGNSSDTKTGGGTAATLQRLPNSDGSTCILVPYTLTATKDNVIFTKDISTQSHATFQLKITWGLSAGAYPNFGTTTFDLDGNFTSTGDQFVPENCAVLNGVAQTPTNPDVNGNFWPAGTAQKPWCLASTGIAPTPFGSDMQVTETFLGSGDPSILRK